MINALSIDIMLSALNAEKGDFLVIGGVNYMIRHVPDLTYDLDVWVRDESENLASVNRALPTLGAEWGRTDENWGPVPESAAWLKQQPLFCLITQHGALEIFREVKGLEGRYNECARAAVDSRTAAGVPFKGLSDQHMLETQLVLSKGEQKPKRIETLRRALGIAE